MGEPLPKYWEYDNEMFKLVCLTSIHPNNEGAYVMESLVTGMNTAFPFHTEQLKAVHSYEEE